MKGYTNVRATVLATAILGLLCASAAHASPGDLNPAFGTDGQVQLALDSFFTVTSPVAIDHHGRIIGGVEISNAEVNGGHQVFALLPDGQLDASFGGSVGVGFSNVLPNAQAQISGLAIDAQDRIVVSAVLPGAGQGSAAAMFERLLPDGTPDPTFGKSGIAVVAMPENSPIFFSSTLAIDASGNIIATGEVFDPTLSVGKAAVIKVDSTGAPAAAFGERGVLVVNPGVGTAQSYAAGVVIDDNDNAIVSGAVLKNDRSVRGLLMKIKPDGNFEPTFGNGGTLEVDALPAQAKRSTSLRTITLDAQQRIVASGQVFTDAGKSVYYTTRLLPNGARDTSFTPAFGDGQEGMSPSSVQVDSAGRIVVSGTASGGVIVYRLTGAGRPDVSFGDAGQRAFELPSLIESSALTADDDIVMYSTASTGSDVQVTELSGH